MRGYRSQLRKGKQIFYLVSTRLDGPAVCLLCCTCRRSKALRSLTFTSIKTSGESAKQCFTRTNVLCWRTGANIITTSSTAIKNPSAGAASSRCSSTSLAGWIYDEIRYIAFHLNRDYPNNNIHNLWTSWKHQYDPSFVVDLQLIRRVDFHFTDVVCSANEELYGYVLSVWKLMLLGAKSGVALCSSGGERSGKIVMVE
jgi:hypothetical protein